MNHPNRRDLLKLAATAAALAVSPLSLPPTFAQPSGPARKKVLFFTKSSGFQHSVITRPKDDPSKLAHAERIITDLGAEHGFDVVCSKDGNVFAPGSIEQFDVFAFYTTGDLTKDSDKFAMKKGADGKNVPDPDKLLHREPGMPPGAKEAFLQAIHDGKGFVGFHCAADTFHSPAHSKNPELLRNVNEKGKDEFDPYIRMLGGEFIVHGKQQEATLRTIDPSWPGAAAFDGTRILEEWYALKNFAPDLHVILAQDNTGMEGPMYQRPPFPQTWARMHGKGRVFYTSMGHREDIWENRDFLSLTVGALNWTSRRISPDVAPNVYDATPEAGPLPASS